MSSPRLQGLDNQAAQRVVATAQALALGRADQALAQLSSALAAYPDHPEVLRLHAGALSLRGEHAQAVANMQRAVALRPQDPLYRNTLGTVLGSSGDFDGAILALQKACELEPGLATAWYNLGVMLTRCVRNDEAVVALRRAVELDSENMDARAQLADMLRMQGHIEESTAEYRKVLHKRPWAGMAWWGLADLRTGALTANDVGRMQAAARESRANDNDRIAIGFALAKALDELGSYHESLDALKRANAIARLHQKWDAPAFSAMMDSINGAFTPLPAPAAPADFGGEALFIVGMPRSGTTLVEQILASHSQVEGAGELPDLPLLLAEESRLRGKPYPQWVADMQSEDWRHLGERYLKRTAHWRERHPYFTDKLPSNWMYIGTIRAMLPGAHIIVCRRDPLETCFSCYRQLLPEGSEYARTPEDIAAFWRDFDRTVNHFAAIHPTGVYQHSYEALVVGPDKAIHGLLDFCGLPFEDACLRFHDTQREVRSPSATQVRQPLRGDTARTQAYGDLLDPLRLSLGLPQFGN